jgi:hypothetical protein
MRTCTFPGCGEPYYCRDYCSRHYKRFQSRGFTGVGPDRPTTAERFWQKVDKTSSPSGCWLWTGEKNNQGYGRFDLWENRRRYRRFAHRFVLELEGVELRRGDVVMHGCDNPPCCNPDHLSVGTQTDNMRDAMAKGRMNLGGLEIGQRMSTPPRRVA